MVKVDFFCTCRAVSDTWLGAEALLPMNFQGLILPEIHPPHTDLLDLDPLPVSALDCPAYEAMYRFSHFNPIQTQVLSIIQLCAQQSYGKTWISFLSRCGGKQELQSTRSLISSTCQLKIHSYGYAQLQAPHKKYSWVSRCYTTLYIPCRLSILCTTQMKMFSWALQPVQARQLVQSWPCCGFSDSILA